MLYHHHHHHHPPVNILYRGTITARVQNRQRRDEPEYFSLSLDDRHWTDRLPEKAWRSLFFPSAGQQHGQLTDLSQLTACLLSPRAERLPLAMLPRLPQISLAIWLRGWCERREVGCVWRCEGKVERAEVWCPPPHYVSHSSFSDSFWARL